MGAGGLGWGKRGFTFPGGGGGGAGGGSSKKGMRDVMAKFKKGRKFGRKVSDAEASVVPEAAVVMVGIGKTESETQTVRDFFFPEGGGGGGW